MVFYTTEQNKSKEENSKHRRFERRKKERAVLIVRWGLIYQTHIFHCRGLIYQARTFDIIDEEACKQLRD